MELSLIVISKPSIPTLSQEIKIYGYIGNSKRGITLEPFGLA